MNVINTLVNNVKNKSIQTFSNITFHQHMKLSNTLVINVKYESFQTFSNITYHQHTKLSNTPVTNAKTCIKSCLKSHQTSQHEGQIPIPSVSYILIYKKLPQQHFTSFKSISFQTSHYLCI